MGGGNGNGNGNVTIKSDGTISSTFNMGNGDVLTYSGSLDVQPDIYKIKPTTCDAVLKHNTSARPGQYSYTTAKVDDVIKVTVTFNAGNTLVIDVPERSVVKSSSPNAPFFDPSHALHGTFKFDQSLVECD